MLKYQASYEDRAKNIAAAKKNGWDGIDGGMLDYIDHHLQTYRDFTTQAEAEAWVKEAIAADKTLFGCGDVEVLKQPKRRCRYCTCNGWLTVQSFIVDDDGADERTDLPEECCD